MLQKIHRKLSFYLTENKLKATMALVDTRTRKRASCTNPLKWNPLTVLRTDSVSTIKTENYRLCWN
jgi:hypothetical protein